MPKKKKIENHNNTIDKITTQKTNNLNQKTISLPNQNPTIIKQKLIKYEKIKKKIKKIE